MMMRVEEEEDEMVRVDVQRIARVVFVRSDPDDI